MGGVAYPVTYTYNNDNSLATVTYPSGRVVSQNYDGMGRLATIASGGTNLLSACPGGDCSTSSLANGVLRAAWSHALLRRAQDDNR